MLDLMLEMNPWWGNNKFDFPGLPRELYLDILEKYIDNKDVILLSGLRRVGKSTILKQIIYKLIFNKKVDPKLILYLSLDSYILKDYSIYDILQEFRKANNIELGQKVYLFLDEVTAKESFNQELKNLYDLGNIKVFASSSSASKLIDKKAYLTGRSRILAIEPLIFYEFLLFRGYLNKKNPKYLLENYFKEYMEFGGIPEYVLTKDPTYITSLVDNIIYKDIVAVNGIKNAEIVKDLFRLLCERVGKQLSYTKIGAVLGIDKDTVKKYIGYFVDTYLFYVIEKDAKSLNERIVENKKIYCADVGIKNVTTGFRDLGAIYENLVFLKIKHFKPRFVKTGPAEIDFKYSDTLIEAKFGQELTKEQQKLYDSVKVKTKIIAKGIDFFL